MRILFSVVLAAVATAAAAAAPHAKRTALPGGWVRVRRHASNATIPLLRFGLTQPNSDMNTLHGLLNDVSHPESPNYGAHWTAARVQAYFAPSAESASAVQGWILAAGVDSYRVRVSRSAGWVEIVNASVAEAEKLLSTEYHVFTHAATGVKHVACNEYHLPAHIAPHVELVTPTIDFAVMLPKPASTHIKLSTEAVFSEAANGVSPSLSSCDSQITPSCLRALYNFNYIPTMGSKNSLGIVEYTPQSYSPPDLDMFAQTFPSITGGSLKGVRPTFHSIDGGVLDTSKSFSTNGESDLDLEYAMNLVTDRQTVDLYQVGDPMMGASFGNFIDAIDGTYCSFEGGDDPFYDGTYPDSAPGGYQKQDCGTVKPANVISTSYGYNEADLSYEYSLRQCKEYAKLGMMGVTIVYSSGDGGVAGNGDICLNADGSQSYDGKMFNPSFPSTCPFVTAVGATQIARGKTVSDPETACTTVIYSGGGFSNYFDMPQYQAGAVKDFFTKYPPTYGSDVFNNSQTARAYPDIAANGANYVIAVDGVFGLVFGTSASAPVVAAMLTMINDARIAVGKSRIGFINPAVYSPAFRGAFKDISLGSNPGCGTQGFNATPGYDPVTGLGTPIFDKLKSIWLQAP
ncbi:unnamed protein product [Mycena citricolor]|uniref:tripeptidyl-peptidase II n=1 Tax=Mycena citricolor TaxID=2018698 RepID=A0AAD2HDG2_9AGAR|nr:unnamed protein product [Mycena citricolor]